MARLSSYQIQYSSIRLPALLWSKFLHFCDGRKVKPDLEVEKALAHWLQSGGDPLRGCSRCGEPLRLPGAGRPSPLTCKACRPFRALAEIKVLGRCYADAKKAANAKDGGFRDAVHGALDLWLESGGDGGRAWANLYDLQGVDR